MKNPEFVCECEKIDPEFQKARQIIAASIAKKYEPRISKKIRAGQSAISRFGENERKTFDFST
jgi:hypothetical protein